jgi:homoserine kinase type II
MTVSDASRILLSRYPASVSRLTWTRLGSAGGFSGAVLWRGDQEGTPAFALKAWPTGFSPDHLESIHRLMNDARTRGGLEFVPAVIATDHGRTVVVEAGRVWDLTAWMPGTADFHTIPTTGKLIAACSAVAALHRAWCPPHPEWAPCPGARRRLEVLADFPAVATRGANAPVGDPVLNDLVRRALAILPDAVARAAASLLPWAGRPVPLHPCLCDIWHDHVLFHGDHVTGLIDYGSVKRDHAAVDLARLLGDLVGDDEDAFRRGLAAYKESGGPVAVDAEFTRLLDRTGLVCAVLHWVRELTTGIFLSNPVAVSRRFERLLARLEALQGRLVRERLSGWGAGQFQGNSAACGD